MLRIFYNNNKSSFQELLDKDNKGVTIYVKNVRALAVEIFKVSLNLSDEWDI